MLRTNVLVIGGGPAGSTAARFLAENNIDTILLERDLSYIKPCGGGIPSICLKEMNLPEEDIVKKKIKKIMLVSPKGDRVYVELKEGYLCITERGIFDSKLREIAQKKGASILEAEFLRFENADKKTISSVKNTVTGQVIKIKSDYVVAADGITFKVGSSIKHDKPDYLYTISVHIKPNITQKNDKDACEFWCGFNHAPSFYSWIFPSDRYVSVGTGGPDAKALQTLLDRFVMRRFNMPLKDLKGLFLTKTRAFKIPKWHKTIFNIKNILFVGDAAGLVMPLTYEGIYYAMKSGEFAARAIIENRPSTYKKLWNSSFRNRFLFMSKLRDYLFKDDEHMEKFVFIHKNQEAQEIAMRLWLKKESGRSALISYMKIFKDLLKI